VLVVAGYDRPMREVFLRVLMAHDGDPLRWQVLFTSPKDAWCDWADVASINSLDSATSFRAAC
jgi:hypothetical protein